MIEPQTTIHVASICCSVCGLELGKLNVRWWQLLSFEERQSYCHFCNGVSLPTKYKRQNWKTEGF